MVRPGTGAPGDPGTPMRSVLAVIVGFPAMAIRGILRVGEILAGGKLDRRRTL